MKKVLKWIKGIALLAVVAGLFYLFLRGIDFRRVITAFFSASPLYMAFFALGVVLQFYLKAWRWGIILKPHGRVSTRLLVNYTVLSFFINLFIPGKAGDPAKGILIARKAGIKKGIGLASVVVERMLDLIIVLVGFSASLLILDPIESPLISKLQNISLILLPVFLFLLVSFYLINLPLFFRLVQRLAGILVRILPHSLRERAGRFLTDFISGLRLKLKGWDYLQLIVMSIAVWLMVIPFYWMLMQGFDFGIPIPFNRVFAWFGIVMASAAIPTPGMVGSLEMGSKIAFEHILHVPPSHDSTVVAYTLLFHFLLVLIQFLWGMLVLHREGITLAGLKKVRKES